VFAGDAPAQVLRILELCGWRELSGLEAKPARDMSLGTDSGAAGTTAPGRFPAKLSDQGPELGG
jgi:hypothetical protein